MAAHWRGRASSLVVTLGVLHCWGWVSCHVERTSEKSPMSHERVKRGWVWNQFFVVEEYTGTEPLYVGKVVENVLAESVRTAASGSEDRNSNIVFRTQMLKHS
ncbi:hypothetical protein MHYP_G00336100 [Metynnis hypsauchen]